MRGMKTWGGATLACGTALAIMGALAVGARPATSTSTEPPEAAAAIVRRFAQAEQRFDRSYLGSQNRAERRRLVEDHLLLYSELASEKPSPSLQQVRETIFESCLARNPSYEARALLGLQLAEIWKRQSELAPPRSLDRARTLARRATALLRQVRAHYGGVSFMGRTVRQRADRPLYELERLGMGMPAPPIEGPDLNGQPLSLSAYRGQVVMLVFWAHW